MRKTQPYRLPSPQAQVEMAEIFHGLLCDEVKAAKSYDQAMSFGAINRIPELEENRKSHYSRSVILRAHISVFAIVPEVREEIWWKLAVLNGSQSKPIQATEILSVLQVGEDHTLADYYQALTHLDADGRELIESTLVPAQEQVCQVLNHVCLVNETIRRG
jgi:hypothetical protein